MNDKRASGGGAPSLLGGIIGLLGGAWIILGTTWGAGWKFIGAVCILVGAGSLIAWIRQARAPQQSAAENQEPSAGTGRNDQ